MTPVVTRELLTKLPKAELHCHLDGSVRPATLLELAREYGKPMPADDSEALAEYMLVRDARSLEDYLERFEITLSVLQRPEALERAAYELVEDAARDGVRYIEMRYAPVLNVGEGLSLGEAVEEPLRGIARAEKDFGVRARVIVCALRHLAPEISLELARLAVAYKDRGVVGFDLAGGERGNPASRHAPAFAFARQHDLAVTVHAGEGDGADSVRQAVHSCCAHRLGHATHLIEDPALTQYVNDRRIALEICLTSNVQTHAVPSYDAHPLREYFDQGLMVVLNTDNRLMSGVSMSSEFAALDEAFGIGLGEMEWLTINALKSAFAPFDERLRLINEVVKPGYARLRQEESRVVVG